jgi:hypothetical protein
MKKSLNIRFSAEISVALDLLEQTEFDKSTIDEFIVKLLHNEFNSEIIFDNHIIDSPLLVENIFIHENEIYS